MCDKILILLFSIMPACLGIDENVIRMSLDYFRYKDEKFVYLLACERGHEWSLKFAKRALLHSIATATSHDSSNTKKWLRFTDASIGVMVDATCSQNIHEIMTNASKSMMLDSNHKWFIVDDNNFDVNVQNVEQNTEVVFNEYPVSKHSANLFSLLETLNTSVDTDIVIAVKEGYTNYTLYEVFSFGKIQGGDLIVKNVGFWNTDNGMVLNTDLNAYKYYRRWDFNQLYLKMVVVSKTPPSEFKPEVIIGREPLLGAQITQTGATIVHVVADTHNFRFKYSTAEKWIGDLSREQTKKAVLTTLYHREQDITPIIRLNPVILKVIDVAPPPVTTLVIKYYYRIPTHGAGKFENQFLRPLNTGAWICVAALMALCVAALLLAAKWEKHPTPGQFAIFSVAATFCQQFFEDCSETESTRRSHARRIAVLVTGLFCVLIYNYYTSSVVSWLLNGPPPSINSLQELLESPLELIYEDAGYTRSWLTIPNYYFNKRNAEVEDTMRKKVLNKKKGAPLFVPVEDGIEMVRNGGYAYHTDIETARILISRKFDQEELCELGSLTSMEKSNLYLALQKDSPYKEFFVWSLTRLKERGIVSCIQRRISASPVRCEGSSPRALALGGAAPAFILLLFGYFAATVIMLFERFRYRHFAVKLRF